MVLPKSIVKEFAKQAVEKKPTVDKPTQLVGTVHVEDEQTFVYLDGSNGSKTPVSETVAYQSGDRVLVSIQNRKATIIGNYTDPSINYSPTVTTGTSSDGSTTLTVTNKDDSTTTVFVDGKARADIDNLEIGGRNYVLKTDEFSSTKNGITIECDGDSYHIYGTNTKTDSDYFLATLNLIDNVLEPGAVYTVSTTEPLPSGVRLGINTQDSSGQEVVAASNSRWYGDGIKTSNTFTCRTDTNGKLIGYFAIEPTCGTVDVTFKIKLEKGNKATDWTPAPEDVDEDIDNVWEKADNAQTSIDNLEIGGRNLLKQYIRAGERCEKIDNLTVKVGTEVADTYFYLRSHCALTAGETYTISCEASNVPDGCNWSFGVRAQGSAWRLYINKNGKTFATGVLDADVDADTDFILDDYDNRPSTAPNIILTNFKLEKGNKATDWTPAPEDIDSRTTVLEAASAKELVRNGFAEFTNDPKLTLGKTTSPWKVVVKNDGIFLQKSSNDVASLSKETSSEETTLRADNARLANVKFRSANGGGKLGIVAQSNGHVSLKEI